MMKPSTPPAPQANKAPWGWAYRSVWLYRLLMRLLYRTQYQAKYAEVAKEVPAGASVVDLCCGDCVIAPMLLAKGCKYTGLDANEHFVTFGRKHGWDVRLWDADTMEIPTADVICMQSSLYHFIPNERAVLDRMLKAAQKKIVISEPVENMAKASSGFLRKVAELFTRVRGRSFTERHSETTLQKLTAGIKGVRTTRRGREMLITIDLENAKENSNDAAESRLSVLSRRTAS
jgi:hypothetical protein